MAEDRELAERVRRRDAQAFDALYREMGPRLVGFLQHLVGNRQAAEDVMQETFAQMWTNPNGFTPERGTLAAYLFGAARKRAAEWWRKHASAKGKTIEKSVECKTEVASLVGDAFDRLPEDQRSLLWLREVEGQSYAELAHILEIPIGTVRSRLFAAREELRAVWYATRVVKREVI